MSTPTFDPYKLCPKYIHTASLEEKRYLFLTVKRGIDFLLLTYLWKHYPEEVVASVPSWLSPYLSEPPPTVTHPNVEVGVNFEKQLMYYKEIIENYLAKELLS